MIQLIAGLGNPGSQYERTRHNAGFWLIDLLAAHCGAILRAERGFYGEMARTTLNGKPLWLLKPMTFMNRSGQSVAALAQFYKIAPEHILIAHDELDLPPGDVKLKNGGSHAGHNGLKSIQADLGTQAYWRMRLGVGHPGSRDDVVAYVLNKASGAHQQAIDAAIEKAAEVVPLLLQGEMERAMMQLHTKPKPEPKPPSSQAPKPPQAPTESLP
jgi:peptidyl-tRNA hydrolase, PTH1 family